MPSRLQTNTNVPSWPGNAYAVTPSDATSFPSPRAIEVIAEGDVAVEAWDNGTQITFTAAPVGYQVPFLVRKVLAATTATVIGID